MPLLARKKILLAKLETTYGTDSSPTGAANAIQTSDLSIDPLAGPTVGRNLDRVSLGNDLQIQVGTFVTLSFKVEVAGAGGVDTPAAYNPLFEACFFGETITAATSVTLFPESEDAESLTMYFHHAGQLHSLVGARGNVSFEMDPGTIPHYMFTFTGLFVTPSSTADPTPVLSAFQTPLPVNNDNMTTCSLHGEALTMVACSLDMGNEVKYRNVVGNESVEIVDRAPSGSITFEAPAISDKDWFTAAKNSDTGVLQIVQGTAVGNIVTINAALTQLISPKYGESDGISTIQAGLALIPSASGNDEIFAVTT